MGWLVWHLTRVQDDHVADLIGTEQIYLTGEWAPRFGAPADPSDIGYGHSAAQVAALAPESAQALEDYYRAVHERTGEFIAGLTEDDLDRVVDKAWDPPVTLGVRLISVVNDDAQHAGQAAYVRGLL
ncbi:mycothiol transferase [Paractinoplanes durhamensis]|uniref:mycothiol transferase n=1 Tax=Paractinoplanes durhamensis TaxID=113563 RepID=UPI00362B15D1